MSSQPPTTFAEVTDAVADVEGWMTPGQARRLWTCGRTVPARRSHRRDRRPSGAVR